MSDDDDFDKEDQAREHQLWRRKDWLADVTQFMKVRTLMNQLWVDTSMGILESYDQWDDLGVAKTANMLQPANSIGDLYELANVVKPIFDSMFKELIDFLSINREADKILSKGSIESFPSLKTAPLNPDYNLSSDSSPHEHGWSWLPSDLDLIKYPMAIFMPLKDRVRVLHKAKESYSDSKYPMERMMDIIRASIVCVSEDHVRWTVNHIASRFKVLRIDNRFKNVCSNGYRDVLVRVGIPLPGSERSEFSTSEGNAIKYFICEIQVHILNVYLFSVHETKQTWANYVKFRVFFGNSDKFKQVVERLKVLKKMDQVGDDLDCLEDLMGVYLQSSGRVSRDIVRIGMFVDLFMKCREDELAERLQFSVIRQLRELGEKRILELSVALGKLANYFVYIKKYSEAEPLSREALEICIKVHGVNHKETSIRNTQLGRLFYCQKKYEIAAPFFVAALDILKLLEGSECNAECIKLMHIIGELYSDMNLHKEARGYYERIIEASRTVYVTDVHPDVADMYNRIGFFEELENNHEEAIKRYTYAIEISKKCYGEFSDQVACGYNCLGYVYYSQRLIATALRHFELENKIRSELPTTKKRAECVNQIGHLFLEMQLYDRAEPYLRKGHELYMEMEAAQMCVDRDDFPEQFYLGFAESKNDLAEYLLRKGPYYFNEVGELLNNAYSWRYKWLKLDNAATKKTLNLQDILIELKKQEGLKVETMRKQKELRLEQLKQLDILRREEQKQLLLDVDQDPQAPIQSFSATNDEDEVEENVLVLPEDTRACRQLDEVFNACNTILADAEDLRDEGNFAEALYKYRKIIQTLYFYKKFRRNKILGVISSSSKFDIDKPNPCPTMNHNIIPVWDDKQRMWLFPFVANNMSNSKYDYEAEIVEEKKKEDIKEILEAKSSKKVEEKVRENRSRSRSRGESISDKDLNVKQEKGSTKYRPPDAQETEIVKYSIERDIISCIVFISYAVYLEDVQNYEEGARILRIVLRNLYEIFGHDYPHNMIAQSQLNLGSILMKMEKYDEALEMLQLAKGIYASLGVSDVSKINSTLSHNIGICLHHTGDLISAETYLKKALELRLQLYGPDDVEYNASRHSIALLYMSQGDYESSFKILGELLNYKEQSVGNVHPSYAVTLNAYAAVHYLVSDLAKAGRLLTESLEFREKLLRKSTKLVNTGIVNLASVFDVQNDGKNSAPFLHASSIIKKYLEIHPHLDK